MSSIPVTVRGAQMLRDELQRPAFSSVLVGVHNAQEIKEARAFGDLSENAEYDAAKERQAFIEGRIAELEGKLSSAQIIDPTTLNTNGKIVFAATVSVEDLETGDRVTYQIVGNDEADLKEFKISITSPMARALIGREEGDVVEVNAPAGVREYEILEVMFI